MTATWTRTVTATGVAVEVALFPGEKTSRALQLALKDYAAFLDLSLTVTFV